LTTIANFAKTNPQSTELQELARTVFAVAAHRAPVKNPNPIAELPGNHSSARINQQGSGSGYYKFFDSRTHAPHIVYPSDYSTSSSHPDFASLGAQVTSSSSVQHTLNPYHFLDGYYDDDLWWALAWINAYDVTHNEAYLHLAEGIFGAVTKSWPTTCHNGGIYWNMTSSYVNAIANELFFSTAAHLANRASNANHYTNWAKRSLSWFVGSGMLNEKGTINDGLNAACENNNGVVWSYNQGVIIGGLVELHHATPDPTYIPLAIRTAHAALDALSDERGIIHDECEEDDCGPDGAQFKGIFMRNLVTLHRMAPDEGFSDVIRRNAESIWQNDRTLDQEGRMVFSVNWAEYIGKANASTQGSAMDALVADVVV
ncbi:Six-hairpin glycosidase, partial [Ophiobolus disseminans]